MAVLHSLILIFDRVLTPILRFGRMIAWMLMALMVLVIGLQVFMRYVVDNALPWPEEAARFMMLWMTGLIAPSAFRRGGFVAIDMLKEMLPIRLAQVLNLFLMAVCIAVLIVGVQFGWKHVNSGWLFSSTSLKVPLSLIGMQSVPIKLAWTYMSIFVGVIVMLAVAVEHFLRSFAGLIDPDYVPPEHPDNIDLATE